jgi:dephospho-CoA kinase
MECPEEIRIQRVMKRDKSSREDVIKKIKNQLTEASKVKVANYIINNDGEQSIVSQVWKMHHTLNNIK